MTAPSSFLPHLGPAPRRGKRLAYLTTVQPATMWTIDPAESGTVNHMQCFGSPMPPVGIYITGIPARPVAPQLNPFIDMALSLAPIHRSLS